MRTFTIAAVALIVLLALGARLGQAQGDQRAFLPLVQQAGTAAAPAPDATTETATPGLSETITPLSTNTATTTPTGTPTPTATRDPSLCAAEYPTVCIPPPPPDLNCGDIPYRRFTVLPPDRHRFDTDNDGIGCEA